MLMWMVKVPPMRIRGLHCTMGCGVMMRAETSCGDGAIILFGRASLIGETFE